MRTAVRALLLAAGLVVGWAGSGSSQERTVDELVRELNQVLLDNSYYDRDGSRTVSEMSLRRGGTLVIRVIQTNQDSELTNVYETNLHTVNLEHIQAHHRGDHTVLMIGCQGDVATKLRNVRSGNVTEWDLPPRGSMSLEFRSGDMLAREIGELVKRLITRAREDPRYSGS